jgi:hypothetical protein
LVKHLRLRPLAALASLGLASAFGSSGCSGKTVALGSQGEAVSSGAPGGGTGGGAGIGSGGDAAGSGASPGGGASGNAGASSGGNAGNAGSGGGRLRFLDASPVAELDTDYAEDNPTLTADGLEIYFTSDRGGDTDVWVARRTRVTDLFGEPEPVAEANTTDEESSPAISLDGLTLWVGQKDQTGGLGGYDIWTLSRPRAEAAWSALVNVTELNSQEDDIPRPAAMANTAMPLGSRRNLDGYRTYLATRPTPDEPFGVPVLLDELTVPGESTVDGFLTEDGLTIFFSRAAAENEGELYYATRANRDASFDEPIPIVDLNTSADERDPWLTPDGTGFYFATDREGTRDIFLAVVSRE